jgi:hypothetical protein
VCEIRLAVLLRAAGKHHAQQVCSAACLYRLVTGSCTDIHSHTTTV